jgi:hypothetical protein
VCALHSPSLVVEVFLRHHADATATPFTIHHIQRVIYRNVDSVQISAGSAAFDAGGTIA